MTLPRLIPADITTLDGIARIVAVRVRERLAASTATAVLPTLPDNGAEADVGIEETALSPPEPEPPSLDETLFRPVETDVLGGDQLETPPKEEWGSPPEDGWLTPPEEELTDCVWEPAPLPPDVLADAGGTEGTADLPCASEECPEMALRWPGGHQWRLLPPALSAYHCDGCAGSWLQPRECCGRPVHPRTAPYYVASVSTHGEVAPEFSVIMLTKNNLALTRIAVESLRRARGQRAIEFVFVDGGSTDGSLNYFADLAREEAVRLIVTHPAEAFIYSRNVNRGAQAARGRFLLFANNDIEARDPTLFDKLARGLSDLRSGAVGVLTDYDCGNELQHQPNLPGERVWSAKPVMGFLWAVRAEVFAEFDGLDEAFADYGCDEVDFQYRAIRRNYRLAVVESMVHHEVHATFGSQVLSGLRRNVERFNVKHGCRLVTGGEWYVPFTKHVYPRVSVALACRNYGRFLSRALDSVLGSYLPPGDSVQVVAVNDASSDDTAAILERYRLAHPEQMTVIHRVRSHGPAMAKNHAITRSVAEIVALLDADDEFLPYKLWRCLETLDATGADFLYHDFAFVLPDSRHERSDLAGWSPDRWQGGEVFSIPPSTWVFRDGVVRFCENYVTGEDPEFLKRQWARLRPVHLPEVLSRYYVHGDALSQRAMCRVVTGQLKGLSFADVGGCSDVPALPVG
jgi:glycosyltransferase involved in cell wall biosynthesis